MPKKSSLKSSQFRAARGASGMTLDQIKTAAGVGSINTYTAHEEEPSDFRLSEIEGMYRSMEEPARTLLRDAVCEIFLPS